jgi:hypothetical protein
LRDAAVFITKLPKAEHDADEWQAAMEARISVAEQDSPTVFARIGVMRALNGHVERVFDTSRKVITGDAASWAGIDDGSMNQQRSRFTRAIVDPAERLRGRRPDIRLNNML